MKITFRVRMMRNMKKLSPQLINAEERFFPAFFTANSLKLRVMLDINARINQFITSFYHSFLLKETCILLIKIIRRTLKKLQMHFDSENPGLLFTHFANAGILGR